MKANNPSFMTAVEIEHAKSLLDDALQRLEANEPGNAFVYLNTAIGRLVSVQSQLIGQTNREYLQMAKRMEATP